MHKWMNIQRLEVKYAPDVFTTELYISKEYKKCVKGDQSKVGKVTSTRRDVRLCLVITNRSLIQ